MQLINIAGIKFVLPFLSCITPVNMISLNGIGDVSIAVARELDARSFLRVCARSLTIHVLVFLPRIAGLFIFGLVKSVRLMFCVKLRHKGAKTLNKQ